MAAIDQHFGHTVALLQRGERGGNGIGIVIGNTATTAQHQMGIGVAGSIQHHQPAIGIHAQRMVVVSGGDHGVHGISGRAIGAVFNAHRHG